MAYDRCCCAAAGALVLVAAMASSGAAAQQVESGPARTQDLSTAPEVKGAPRPPGFIDARPTMPRDEYFRAKARANALMREQGGRRRLPPGAVSQP